MSVSIAMKTYLSARQQVHSAIVDNGLLQSRTAVFNGREVRMYGGLHQPDGVHIEEDTRYLPDPYRQDDFDQQLFMTTPQGSLRVYHECERGLFSTTETLKIEGSGCYEELSGSHQETTRGLRPEGWLQEKIEEHQGFLLKL